MGLLRGLNKAGSVYCTQDAYACTHTTTPYTSCSLGSGQSTLHHPAFKVLGLPCPATYTVLCESYLPTHLSDSSKSSCIGVCLWSGMSFPHPQFSWIYYPCHMSPFCELSVDSPSCLWVPLWKHCSHFAVSLSHSQDPTGSLGASLLSLFSAQCLAPRDIKKCSLKERLKEPG